MVIYSTKVDNSSNFNILIQNKITTVYRDYTIPYPGSLSIRPIMARLLKWSTYNFKYIGYEKISTT